MSGLPIEVILVLAVVAMMAVAALLLGVANVVVVVGVVVIVDTVQTHLTWVGSTKARGRERVRRREQDRST